MTRFLARVADIAYRRRGRMVLAWIVAAVVIIGVGFSLAGENHADYNTPGSESKAASDLTKQRFAGYSGQEVYVVWKDPAGATSSAARARLNAFFADASKVDNLAPHTQIRLSRDGKIASTTLPLTVDGWDVPKASGEKLIAAADRHSGNGLEIKLGGDPIYAAQGSTSPEGLGFLGAAVVLLIAFGSLVAAGLPLAIALIGLGISSGLIALLANVVDVPEWTTAVSGLIGIGVGIDYALLVLTRFRSAMSAGKERHDAVVEAVTTAGRSVLIAGATVVVAVLGLALTGLSYMYGVALSASIAVLVVMLAAVMLLPALLSYLGPKVDRLRVPFLSRSLKPKDPSRESPAARWSHAVQRRPWAAAITAVVILLALAAPALGMRLGFPDAGNDPSDTMTRKAYDLNTEGFGPGANGPLVVAADLSTPSAKSGVEALALRLRKEPGIAFVTKPQINGAGDAAIMTVIPTGSPQDKKTEDLVNHLRNDVVPTAIGNSGALVQVGGVTAALEDQSEYMKGRMPLFITGVVGLSFLLLLVAFHSPLISLKAAIMNLLSVSAAYGVMTLVAKGGPVASAIGIDHEVPIAPFMPVMMFAILFGLSMDYEVFLISRIREEYLKDGNTRRAIADGLAKTARVITAAAAIMVVVFLSFLAAPDTFLKLFGIGLASAIFLDATLVRLVLVPAVMQLLGPANWWIPNWLERVLPRLDVERVAVSGAEGRS